MTFLYAKYEKEGKKGRGGLAGHPLNVFWFGVS
jgi:hypothetical protein